MSKQAVTIESVASSYGVLRDGKSVLTPMKNVLALPNTALADAVAAEWRAQSEPLRKDIMHLTQIACIAIDLVPEKRDMVLEEVLGYGDTDTVCYRAGNIPALQKQQAEYFAPVIAWADHRFAVKMVVTDGVVPVRQPKSNHKTFHSVIAEYDNWRLGVLAFVIKPLSSLVLALALMERQIDAEQAFRLSHLEELYETQQWGQDELKEAKMKRVKEELEAAEKFLSLL
jgi:chaperone required for assembly of F1-ATPase